MCRAIPSSARLSLDGGAIRPVPDETERGVDSAVEQRAEGQQHVRHPLDRRHAPDPADDEALLGDPEQPPELGSSVAAHAVLEVDPEPDHHELVCRRDTERDEVVSHLRPDRDEPCRVPGECALGLAEEARADRVEVPAEHVTVVGVDDHRRPRVACEQRGRATDRARLGRVGVQDVRTDAADLADEPADGGRVGDRRDLAPELGHVDHFDPELVGDERHRVLAACQLARHERRRVPAPVETARQVRDVQRRAAHVEPGDDAEDPNLVRSRLLSHRAGTPRCGAVPPRARRRARSRAPRARGCRPPTTRGCRRPAAARRCARPASRARGRSRPRAR